MIDRTNPCLESKLCGRSAQEENEDGIVLGLDRSGRVDSSLQEGEKPRKGKRDVTNMDGKVTIGEST